FIIEKILRTAIESHGYQSYTWKYKFPFLAICSEWRRLALRMVYRDAFADGMLQYNKEARPDASTVVFSTNIDLITALGYSRHVRSLFICLEKSRFILPFVREMPRLFAFDRNRWDRVEMLWLNMYQSTMEDNTNIDREDAEIENMATLIIKHMPHVTKLRLDSSGDPAILGAGVKSRLLGRYALQLNYLKSGCYVVNNIRSFTDELTYLELRINHSSLPLMPKVNPRALQKLVLIEIPLHFSWSYFATTGNKASNEINFSNLRWLEMFFTAIPEESEQNPIDLEIDRPYQNHNPYAVRFPKLDHLGIVNYSPDAQLSFIAEYPEKMRKISLRYSFVPPKVFASSKISEISILDISMCYAQLDHASEFYGLTNHLLGSSIKIEKRSSLLLSYAEFALDMSQCRWDNITVLRLLSQVSYEALEALTRRMQHLELLAIYELTFSEQTWQRVDDGVSLDLEEHTMERVTPWKTSVEHLDILSLAYVSCPDVVAMCLKRYMLHVTTLSSLNINGCEAIGLGDFVNMFQPQYPHLSRIMLSD
ncbi:hypothetical protein GGI15_003942, partial [Coemansia interrupta]